jgi:hypothetical protein
VFRWRAITAIQKLSYVSSDFGSFESSSGCLCFNLDWLAPTQFFLYLVPHFYFSSSESNKENMLTDGNSHDLAGVAFMSIGKSESRVPLRSFHLKTFQQLFCFFLSFTCCRWIVAHLPPERFPQAKGEWKKSWVLAALFPIRATGFTVPIDGAEQLTQHILT